MEPITMEKLTSAIRESVKAEMAQHTPAPAEPAAPLNPLANRQVEEILSSEEGVKALQSLFDGGKLTWPKVETARQAQDKPEGEATEAEMGQNMVADTIRSVDRIGGGTLPLGSALAGGFLGFTGVGIINGLVPSHTESGNVNFIRPLAKVAVAWGAAAGLPPVTGKTGAVITSALLLFSAAQDVFDLEGAVNNVADWVRNLFSGFGFGGGNRFHQYDFHQPPALNAGGGGGGADLGQFISGVGEAGSNRLDYVFDPR